MAPLINYLIEDQLNLERVRDMVVYILITERDNQKALATADGKNPSLWDFKVAKEKSQPYTGGLTWCNVWFDSENPNGGVTDGKHQFSYDLSLNIDIVSYVKPEEGATGFDTGSDTLSALECQIVLRLVHSIIYSGQYTYLNMRRVVKRRWPGGHQSFQRDLTDRPADSVQGIRLKLNVDVCEFTPQYIKIDQEPINEAPSYDGDTLDEALTVCEDDAGNTLFSVEYDLS